MRFEAQVHSRLLAQIISMCFEHFREARGNGAAVEREVDDASGQGIVRIGEHGPIPLRDALESTHVKVTDARALGCPPITGTAHSIDCRWCFAPAQIFARSEEHPSE